MTNSVSISTSRPARWTTLCALYFAQGIPWGFVTVALVAFLNEQGVSRQETALLISWSLFPWTFKLIWGPLIDTFQFPSLGLRRPWIVVAQLMMAVTLLAASTTADLTATSTLTLLVGVLFVHNCFASLQDVATDAMAIDLLLPEERGKVNGFMWGSKLVGISIGGALLATVLVNWGLAAGMRVQALLIVAIMLLPLFIRERVGEKLFPWSNGKSMAPIQTALRAKENSVQLARVVAKFLPVCAELRRAFGHRTTIFALLLSLVSWVALGLHEALTPSVFTQTLGWSAEEFARARGIGGGVGELAGALLGGFLCDRVGRRITLGVGSILTAAAFIGFASMSVSWSDMQFQLLLFLVVIQALFAVTSVSFLALAMKLSWTAAAATQFTIFMTLVNLGFALGPYLTRLEWSDAGSYMLCGVLSLLPLAVLPLLDPDAIARRRADDLRLTLTEAAASVRV